MVQRVVVAGAGLGALRSAESLRAYGYTGELVVIGAEPDAPYARPPLSKGVLSGAEEPATLTYRRRPALDDVQWRLGHAVVGIDLAQHEVRIDDGARLEYSALVLATGARARRLEVPGPPPTHRAGRHVLRTIPDAVRIRQALVPGTRLVVVGAGFIGCELAATATRLGCSVVCVTAEPEPMTRPLGARVGREVRRRLEHAGIAFRTGVGVDAFLGADTVSGVMLSDSSTVPADVVVEAVGSVCNIEPVAGTGWDLSDGVLTDAALRPVAAEPARTGDPAVHDGVAVVGDVARFPQPLLRGAPARIEHWSVPTDTGRRAGQVLAAHLEGRPPPAPNAWPAVPHFWSEQPPVRIHALGLPGAGDPQAVRLLYGELSTDFVVGYVDADEHLVGVVGLGDPRGIHRYRDALGTVVAADRRPVLA